MTFSPILDTLLETPSRRSQATQMLRAAILSGEMSSGTVYSAPALAGQFGVSATPVREAMIDLAKEGLVVVVRNKGFRISEPSKKELDDILELRLLLEVPFVRKVAAAGISDEQRATLTALAQDTVDTAARGDLAGHVTADQRFHLALLSLSGNEEIVDIVRILRSRSRLTGLGLEKNQPILQRASQEHLQLVELVAAKKADAAEKLIESHIMTVVKDWSPLGDD